MHKLLKLTLTRKNIDPMTQLNLELQDRSQHKALSIPETRNGVIASNILSWTRDIQHKNA